MIPRRIIRIYNGEIFDLVNFVLKHNIISGDFVKKFEEKFGKKIGTDYNLSLSKARHGLCLIFKALGLEKGSEVIMPAYSINGVVNAIKALGLKPRTVDISEDSLNINPRLIEKKINNKTKAVLAAHMYGVPCEIEKIRRICKKNKLYLIEDCAHSPGLKIGKYAAGSFGDAAIFSFDTIKPLNTFEGGIVSTNDKSLYVRMKAQRDKLKAQSRFALFTRIFSNLAEKVVIETFLSGLLVPFLYFDTTNNLLTGTYKNIGQKHSPEKLTNLQAYIGLRQLEYYEEWTNIRKNNSEFLKSNINLESQYLKRSQNSTYYFLVFKYSKNIRAFQKRLLLRGIDINIKNELADRCNLLTEDTAPVTQKTYSNVIQIPNHEKLTKKDLTKLVNVLNKEVNN
ncbi:MAG: aminotransferase class I/II-fold pyridoxal phosphate-dependent enzyme [Nanobdellota archaeon]